MRAVWLHLDQWARGLSPVALALVLVILGIVPTRVPGFAQVAPVLVLVAVYHWAFYRPSLFPVAAVFGIGILQDLLSGAPVGLNALVFLTVYGLVGWQRRFLVGKSFLIYWFGFAVIAAVGAVETWVLLSAFYATFVPAKAIVVQYLLMLGIFPVIAWFFLRWQRAFLEPA